MSALGRAVRRPIPAFVLLFLAYLLLSLVVDPGGSLGADTGAKTYTLEIMSREDSTSPDIGYWAAEHDEDGSVHPIHHTLRRADGSWVAVTTLPMLELGNLLYRVGGYRAALLLPMLAGVLSALAARSISRRLRPGDDRWGAFWIVGLGSPVAVYALDFWEHAPGLAAMLAGIAVLLAVLDGRPLWSGVLAGVLFGTAAVMRNEALVYTLVAVGIACVEVLKRRRSLWETAVLGISAVVGFVVPWVANVVLERALDGPSRGSRATGRATDASSSIVSELGQRAEEGLQTLVGLTSGTPSVSILLGAAVVAAVAVAWRAERRSDRTFAVVCVVAAIAVYVADAAGGLGFIPGLLVAFPLAIAGLVPDGRSENERVAVLIAVVALPLVYLFQYLNAAGPQWGGRYSLTSGILLGLVGLGSLEGRSPMVARSLVALSVAVTALGIAWVGVRTHRVDRFFDRVERVSEPVLVARQAFVLREGGASVVDRRWLSAADETEFTEAVDIARKVGEERFSVLEWDAEAPPESVLPGDVVEIDRTRLDFLGTPVGLVTYEFVE